MTDWQILGRGRADTSSVTLAGTVRPARLMPELPLAYESSPGTPRVSVRVVRESDGSVALAWRPAVVGDDGGWTSELEIPAGGAYRIETRLDPVSSDGSDFTRGDAVHHVGVGDVWLVIGQSNASGRAREGIEDSPVLGIHQYRSSGRWDLASHPLMDGTRAVHLGNLENHNPGHSPGLHFAKQVSRAVKLPLGLVVASYGGSPLRWWIDDNGLAPLALNALQMLDACGSHPRGVIWYQGEADCFEATSDDYADRFGSLVSALRERLGDPELPFFTAQLARCTLRPDDDLDRQWGMLREQQRRAARQLDRVYVVPTGDLPLSDAIHLSAAANLVLAERLASAALDQVYGLSRRWQPPEIGGVSLHGRELELRFSPIYNGINDYGLPAERCPFDVEDVTGFATVLDWHVRRDSCVLVLDRDVSVGGVVHGMWRMDHGGVVPADTDRMPFLSFYGVPIS